jgi:hypothetical protein
MSTFHQRPLRVPEQYPVFLLERIEDPRSDLTALGHEQIGHELTAERLGPNGARRSQAAGNALAFAVQSPAVQAYIPDGPINTLFLVTKY